MRLDPGGLLTAGALRVPAIRGEFMPATVSKTRLMVAMILVIYVYGSIAALLGTILPQLGERFGLDDAQLGYIALAQALGLAIASVSVGPLIDNKGKKTALVGGLIGITTALVLLAHASGYGMVLGSMLLLGLGGGMIVTGGNMLISDVAEERRSAALNLLNLFFGLGGLATPFFAANIPALNGSYALCLFLASIAGLTLIIHAATAMPPPTGERGFVFSQVSQLLNQPALYLLSLLLFLYVACEVGVFNWLVQYLVSQGVAQSRAQNILSLGFALGLLIGRLVVSRILLGVAEIKVTLFAAVSMAVTTFAMLQVADPLLAAIMVFLAGVSMAPVFPTTLGMVGNVFTKMTATAMGIVITSGWIGLAISSPIIGWIANRSSLATGLLLIPAMAVIMIVINLALRPYVTKR
jgi:fucose permease